MTEDANAIIILLSCGVVGLLYGIWNYIKVRKDKWKIPYFKSKKKTTKNNKKFKKI